MIFEDAEQTEEIFSGLSLDGETVQDRIFTDCLFEECSLVEANLARCRFCDCRFVSCNLTLPVIDNTGFRGVHFSDCKLMGLIFSKGDPFLMSVSFDGCSITSCTFCDLSLPRTRFCGCTINETDFMQCDLAGSDFSETRFGGCVFERNRLNGCNFSGAGGFFIDPSRNNLAKASFDPAGALELLARFDIVID